MHSKEAYAIYGLIESTKMWPEVRELLYKGNYVFSSKMEVCDCLVNVEKLNFEDVKNLMLKYNLI